MNIEQFQANVEEMIQEYPAVGIAQRDSLMILGICFSSEYYSEEEVVYIILEHMQKYYGFST